VNRERDEALLSLSYGLPPYLFPPFLGWSIPASLLLICDFSLQNISRFSPEPGSQAGGRERFARRARAWQRHIFEVLNALFSSFVNLLSFHYKRHNQNKADSTVNKTETS